MSAKEQTFKFGDQKTRLKVGGSVVESLPSPGYKGQKAILISDQDTPQIFERVRIQLVELGWDLLEIPVEAGEDFKRLESVNAIFGQMIEHGCQRDAYLFALGGGTIGDTGGFIAGTYMRGICWVGIPTTLLSQVDSCLGGKTGVNHHQGKNLIGVFHQPTEVICDVSLLKTIPSRELNGGLGEVWKYGIAQDKSFYDWLILNNSRLLIRDIEALTEAVFRSLQNKAKVVEEDVRDERGIREVLNFGHTFGHALEKVSEHSIRHGEAIVVGMKFAVQVSLKKKMISKGIASELIGRLNELPIQVEISEPFDSYLEYMKRDKKNKGGGIRMVLLTGVGASQTSVEVSEEDLSWAFQNLPI